MDINISLLQLILSYIVGYGVTYYWVQKKKQQKEVRQVLENAIFLQLAVWKLSYILLYFNDFVQSPFSLLYFTGGFIGFALSTVSLLFYFLWMHRKTGQLSLYIEYTLFGIVVAITTHNILTLHLHIAIPFLGVILFYMRSKTTMNFLVTTATLSLFIFTVQEKSVWSIAFLLLLGSGYLIIANWKRLQLQHVIVALLVTATIVPFQSLSSQLFRQQESDIIEWKSLPVNVISNDQQERTFSGKEELLILNFFASWCPPCNAEMPQLTRFFRKTKTDATVLLAGLNATQTEKSLLDVERFIEDEHVTFPILLDHHNKWMNRFQVYTFPTTIIINQKGEVLYRHVGPISANTLLTAINNIKNKATE